MRTFDPVSLYYITHIDSLPSILDKGILAHRKIEELNVSATPIYNPDIVSKRKDKSTPDGKSLWDYANLYFQPRNPMMYCLVHQKEKEDLVVVGVLKKRVARTRCCSHGWQRRPTIQRDFTPNLKD